jgi:hypothetical protein
MQERTRTEAQIGVRMCARTAQERLTGAPSSSPFHRRVEIVVVFVATMLIGATRRSNGDNRVWRRQPTFSSGYCSSSRGSSSSSSRRRRKRRRRRRSSSSSSRSSSSSSSSLSATGHSATPLKGTVRGRSRSQSCRQPCSRPSQACVTQTPIAP